MLEATAIQSIWSGVNGWFTPAVLFLILNLTIATIALTSSLTQTPPPPSHDMHPYPHDGEDSPTASAAKQSSPTVSILDWVIKSLGVLISSSPGKSSTRPLIPPEELYDETKDDPFGRQGLGKPRSVGKLEAFDLYGYPNREPVSGSNPAARYIFEPTLPQEVLFPAERDEKVGEEGNGDVVVVEESQRAVPILLQRRGVRRSESLNMRLGEDVGVESSVEKRRPATTTAASERKGKWGVGGEEEEEEEVDARADDFINRFKQQLKLQRMDSLVSRHKA